MHIIMDKYLNIIIFIIVHILISFIQRKKSQIILQVMCLKYFILFVSLILLYNIT